MKDLLKRLFVSVVEPPNVFEQLEERIVLDATVDQVQVNGADVTANPQASVAEDATSVVDIHSVSEGSGATYSLKVDGQDVAAYNAGNGNKADVDVATDNFAATGKFSWTPNNLDVGIHSFEVTANDGGSGAEPHTDIETIQLTVYNVAPTFSSGAVATFVADSGGQTFDVQSGDENLGSTYSLDGAPGWLSIDPTSGVISGNPTYAHTGDYSFAVRVNDGHVSVDQDFILTVNNTLDFLSSTSQTMDEDEAFLYDARTDTEALGKPVTYSLQPGAPAWLSIDSETGVVTGNPDNSHVGVHTFTVHAESTEGNGNLNFTLTVQNTPPVFLNQEPTIQMIESSGPQTFDVQNNDENTPSGLPAYSILSYDGIDYGAVGFPIWLSIDSETGIITGNPLNQDVGVHTIVVQFDDSHSPDGVRTHIFSLDIDNVPNYFESSNATTWVEDAAGQSFDVQTHEEGVIVEPAHVTYSFEGGALTWGGWLQIDAGTGVLSPILGTQPDNSRVGTHVFDIWSNEGYGAPVVIQEDFTLTVVNAVPIITSPATTQIQEDAGSATFQVTLASPEPGATYSLQYWPDIHGSPVTIDAATGLMTIPGGTNVDVGGTYLFNVVVNDTHGGIATQFFRIDVTNVAPVFTQLPDPLNDPHVITVNEDSSYTFDINVPAPINDEGDGPTFYRLVGEPGFVSIDSSTGQISVNNPGNNDVGTHNFTVQLNDGHGGVASAAIRLVVNNVAPDIPGVGAVTWYEDGDTNLDGNPDGQGWQMVDVGTAGAVSDEGQGATYSLVGAPSWLTIGAGTGVMSYVPANANVGTHVFTVHIDDGHGGSDDQTFTLNVLNSPPKFDGLYGSGNTTLYVNQSGGVQVFDPQTTDEASNRSLYGGTPNQYSLISAPAGITLLNTTTGQFSADPAVLGLGTFGFTIRFFDGSVSVDQAVTVVVTNVPPNSTDPVNFDPGFYSPNNTSFIEDTGNQTFNIQYQTEGTSGTLRYDLVGAPSWLVFQDTGTQTGSSTGVITANPTNVQTTDVNPGTPYAFEIRVYDPAASLDFNTDFTLAVTNNPPLFNEAPFNVVFTEDQDYTAASTPYDVNTTDEPHDNPSYPNTYSLANGTDTVPTWLKITDDGKIYIDRGVAGPDQHRMVNDDVNYGPWNLKVVFNDAHGGIIDRAITVSVQNVLQFQDPGHHYSVVWQEDRTSPFNTTTFEAVTDDDPSADRHVTYSLTNLPGWLMDGINPKVGIDPDTGVVFMRPGYESTAPDNTIPGAYFFTIVANDTHGTTTQNVSITVPNRDPVFAQTVFNIGEDNGADVINLQVDDEGQGATYYTWSGAPQWMSLDPFTGEITTDPTNRHVGDTPPFTVTAYDLNAGRDYGYADLTDPDGIHGSTTETITVHVLNRDPEFLSPGDISVQEDSPLAFDVQTDDESDGGTKYYFAGGGLTWGAGATWSDWVTLDEDTGLLTANPTNAHVGTHTFQIICNDQHGGIVAQDFTLTVTNQAPSFLNPPGLTYTMTLTEDTTGNYFNILTDDEGKHNPYAAGGTGTQVTYSLSGEPTGVSINSLTGLMTFSPDNRHVGSNTFNVIVNDGNGGITTLPFTMNVTNTAPVFETPNAIIWYEDVMTNIPFNVETTDEGYDRLSGPLNAYSLIGAPAWLQIDPVTGIMTVKVGGIDGTQNTDGSRGEIGSPDNHMVGTSNFTIRFFDGTVTADQAFSLTVNNDPTEINDIHDEVLTQDTTLQIVGSHSLPDPPNQQVWAVDDYNVGGYTDDYYTLEIKLDNVGSWIRVDNGAYNAQNGAWNGADITFVTETGEIQWTPNNADVPNADDPSIAGIQYHHNFRITHYDGHGSWASDEFFVSVNNIAPVMQGPLPLPNWALIEDQTSGYTYDQDNIDSDEEGYGVTYDLEVSLNGGATWTAWTPGYRPNGSDGGVIVLNEQSGEIQWQTTNADVTLRADGITEIRSPYVFRVRADDGNPTDNYSAPWQQFTVTVQNDPTLITAVPPSGDVPEDSNFQFNIQARDEEVERTGLSTYYDLIINDGSGWQTIAGYNGANGLRADVIFNTDTGLLQWNPNHEDTLHVGNYQFQVTHYDGNFTSDTETFTFTVTNRPPDVNTPTPWTLHEDDTVSADYTLTLTSDDDPYVDVDYQLEVYADLDGNGSYAWETVNLAGILPNGPIGGLLTFDPETGTIIWPTTNEDVTFDDAGNPTAAYQFRVSATDNNGSTWSNWEAFDVVVQNDATNFSTDVGTQTLTQDALMTVTDAQVQTNDEYANQPNFPADDYYTLEISLNNDGTWIVVDAVGSPQTHYNLTNNAWNGADIFFYGKTGEIQWTPNNADVPNIDDPSMPGTQYHHQVRVTHHDGHGSTDVDDFFVEVTNIPPSLIHPAATDYVLREDLDTLSFTDADIGSNEEGFGVTYILEVSLDNGGSWTTLNNGNRINQTLGGIINFDDDDGILTWTPTNADVTASHPYAYKFKVTADDNTPPPTNLSPNSYEFTVTVTNTNTLITSAPPAGPTNVNEDSTYSYNIVASDEGHDWTGNIVTYYDLQLQYWDAGVGNWSTAQDYADYNNNNDGNDRTGRNAVNFNTATGAFSWTPNHIDTMVGDYKFIVTHHDDNGSTDTKEFLLHVVNRAPVITAASVLPWNLTEEVPGSRNIGSDDEALDGRSAYTGGPTFTPGVVYTLRVNNGVGWTTIDADGEKINGDDGGAISINSTSGLINWQPTNADVNVGNLRPNYQFEVTASDGIGNSVRTFNVTVNNAATSIDSAPASGTHVTEDMGITHNIEARDEGHDWVVGGGTDIVTYYDLQVQYWTGSAWSTAQDFADYNDNSVGDTNDRGDRGAISFDTDDGDFAWTPNHLDTLVGQYRFTVTHHDDNGSNVSAVFDLIVDNRTPQYVPGSVPATLPLIEDIAGGFDAQTDDELLNGLQSYPGGPTFAGVTYSLEIFSGGTWNTVNDGDQINGPGGGLISFDDATGVFSWDTRNADVTQGNGRSPYQFRITAGDGVGTTQQAFDVTVTNAATGIDAAPGDQTITEDVGISYNIHAIDEAHDWIVGGATDIVTYYDLQVSYWDGSAFTAAVDYLVYNGANGDRGDVTFDTATGQFDWVPNHIDAMVGDYRFIVTHHDDNGSTDDHIFSLDVANRVPQITDPGAWTLTEEVPDSLNIASDDELLDNGTSYPGGPTFTPGVVYTLRVNNGVGWTTIDADGEKINGDEGGAISINSTSGLISWNPTNADVNAGNGRPDYQFEVTASDGIGNSVRTFDVTVNNAATSIDSAPASGSHVTEDMGITHNIEARDEGHDWVVGGGTDIVTYYDLQVQYWTGSAWSAAASHTVYNGSNGDRGDVTFDTDDGDFAWTPNHLDTLVGQYRFTVTHHDDNNSNVSAVFDLIVDNRTPQYVPGSVPATLPLIEDTAGGFDAQTDDELLNGLQSYPGGPTFIGVTYSLEIFSGGTWNTVNDGDQINGPGGGLISFDDTTGVFSWDTRNADVTEGNGRSPYQFRITAGDGVGTTQQAFDVTVTNAATLIDAAPGDQTITEDVGISYNIHAIDEAHDWIVGGATDIVTYYDLQVSYWDGSAFTASVDYVAYNGANGDRGDVTFDTATGQFDWVPNHIDTMVGDYRFIVTHHDDNGSTDDHIFSLDVANRVPQITDPGAWTLTEEVPDSLNIASDDEALDNGTSYPGGPTFTPGVVYTLRVNNGVGWTTIDADGEKINGDDGGAISINSTSGMINWQPTNADVNVGNGRPNYQFEVTASDGIGSSVRTFNVTVNNAATSIDSAPASGTHVTEDMGITHNIQARDEGHDWVVGGGTDIVTYYDLQVQYWTGSAWSTAQDFADYNDNSVGDTNDRGDRGAISFDTDDGDFAWTPNHLDTLVGQYRFTVTHHDDNGSNVSAVFDLIVDNRTPQYVPGTVPATLPLIEDIAGGFNAQTDDELLNGLQSYPGGPTFIGVTYSLEIFSAGTWNTVNDGDQINGPGGGLISFDDATGVFSWDTRNADVTQGNGRSPYQFRITAGDGVGTTQQAFDVTVTNAATLIDSAPGDQTITEDVGISYNIHAIDEAHDWIVGGATDIVTYYDLQVSYWDGSAFTAAVDYLVYNGSNCDRGDVTFDTATGQFDWVPNHIDTMVGDYRFIVTHHDDNGSTDDHTFSLDVANRVPQITDPGAWTLTEEVPDSLNIASDDELLDNGTSYPGGPTFTPGVVYTLRVNNGVGWTTIDADGEKINGDDGGAISINSTSGLISWNPTNADVNVGNLRPNYQFEVTASDGIGNSVRTFNVTVNNAATSIDSAPASGTHVTEDMGITHNIQARDEGHDWVVGGGTDIVTYYDLQVQYWNGSAWSAAASHTAYNGSNGDRGDVTFDTDDGDFAWTPNHLDTLVGQYRFTVTHHDDNGSNVSAVFDLMVDNRTPQYVPGSVPATLPLIEDIAGGFDAQTDDELLNGLQSYPGGPNFTGVTYSLEIFSGGTWNTVNDGDQINGPGGGLISFDDATGVFSWDTRNADVTQGNGRSPYQFRITAGDGVGTTQQAFDVTVTNAATLIDSAPGDQTITEDVGISYNIHAIDEAHDWIVGGATDIVTYYDLQVSYWDGSAFTASVDYVAYNASNGDRGDVTFDTATGQFDWVPNNADTAIGQFRFTVTHHDDNGTLDSRNFTLTVLNNPPTLTVPGWWLLHEDDTNPADYTLDQTNISSDDEGLGLTYRLFINGNEFSTSDQPNGATGGTIYFDTHTGEVRWPTTNADVTFNSIVAPVAPTSGAYIFTIEANDGNGGITTTTFQVDVYNAATDVNDVPNQVVDEDTALSLGDPDVTAIDERIGGGTFYTLEIDRSGDGAGFIDVGAYNALVTAGGGAPITFDTSTGAIDWAPRNADVGQYTFQVTHFDGHASNDADQFDVTVRNTAPEFTSSPDTSMLRPGMHFTYNPSTTDEGQHDWRGDPRDDRVVYSLDTPPSGMTVNPDTGLIQWEATLPGNYTITVLVHDGNGGIATQTFDLFVAALIDELPIEHRPDTATQNTSFGENSVFGGRDHGEKGLGLPPGVPGGLLGSTPMTSLQGRLLPDDALMPLYSGHGLEDIFKQGASGPEDLLAWLEGHDLKQPSLEPAGSTAPITPLTGYGSGVAHGQRLDFSAEELHLWQDLLQPQLVHGGSESPDTPLEGFASAIEEGRRLNFNHYPIREARAFLLEDLRAGDVLGL